MASNVITAGFDRGRQTDQPSKKKMSCLGYAQQPLNQCDQQADAQHDGPKLKIYPSRVLPSTMPAVTSPNPEVPGMYINVLD